MVSKKKMFRCKIFNIFVLTFALAVICSGCGANAGKDGAFFKVESKYDKFMGTQTNLNQNKRVGNVVYIGAEDTTRLPNPGRTLPDEPNFEFDNLTR